MVSCINRPIIGVDGDCGFEGLSGRNLSEIGLSLKKAANVTDDQFTGKEFIEKIEGNAINKVINDVKLLVSRKYAFTPVFDVINKFWQGTPDKCNMVVVNTPIGLRIENICRDNFRSNRLDWIELYVDNSFTVEAVIEDGAKQTAMVLEFVPGLNRKEINYTFESGGGVFWMRLCNGTRAYVNGGCSCNCDGKCGCGQCADVYAWEMVEGGDIECEEPTQEFLDENGFETAEEYFASLGYQDSLNDGTKFIEPKCQAASKNPFGYQVSCLCSYDWLFCHFQNEMAYAIMLYMGVQIYERSKQTERFNEYWEGAKENADYYLKKWLGGISKITGEPEQGEYKEQIKYIADVMINYISKSDTPCLHCKPNMIIQTSIP